MTGDVVYDGVTEPIFMLGIMHNADMSLDETALNSPVANALLLRKIRE